MSDSNPAENLVPIGAILERLIKPLPEGVVFRPGAWHWLALASGVTKEAVFPAEAIARIDYQAEQPDNPKYGALTWYHFSRDIDGREWQGPGVPGNCSPCLKRSAGQGSPLAGGQ